MILRGLNLGVFFLPFSVCYSIIYHRGDWCHQVVRLWNRWLQASSRSNSDNLLQFPLLQLPSKSSPWQRTSPPSTWPAMLCRLQAEAALDRLGGEDWGEADVQVLRQ